MWKSVLCHPVATTPPPPVAAGGGGSAEQQWHPAAAATRAGCVIPAAGLPREEPGDALPSLCKKKKQPKIKIDVQSTARLVRRQPYGKCRSRLSAANQHASKGNRKGRVAVQPGGFGGQKLCEERRLKYFSERGERISGRRRSLRCLWLLTPKTKKVMGCSPTLVKLASRYFSISSLFQTSWLWLSIFQPQSRAFKKKAKCCDSPDICPLLEPWLQNSEYRETGKIKGSVMLQPCWLFSPTVWL